MASLGQLLLAESILSAIFTNTCYIKPADDKIISNTREKCIFSTHFDVTPLQVYLDVKDFLVRPETTSLVDAVNIHSNVIDIHKMAHAQLPDIAPFLLDHGTTVDSNGIQVESCVTAYYVNTISLGFVWNTLEQA
ncbi:hypothetical protein BKA67DRAFT_672116 [Truncatella angustata]|uniref:Uncharacterized protein n=1 Tax=Truncatella angustata TaxID=152316 RepID=A0A9P8UQN1_9PEZI|nr:uncharacterized protein BKA67DRAFT_672116 [Truncatella angustata]KAH6656332.1 hypothetical protein BKA67DRAFT_672116 [Truncatella angustata]